ncbi:hypothetical protein AB0L65_21255 [Nonomuraea sp. NPDC052116]|uniref:hypothetical protein n=1 Tax=Nonomuraea sp. NPDC052116 TaxID=3155665 RepID=UPI0034316699
MAAPAGASASTETTTASAQLIRWAACTVRTRALSQSYNNWLDGFSSFNRYANRYYR